MTHSAVRRDRMASQLPARFALSTLSARSDPAPGPARPRYRPARHERGGTLVGLLIGVVLGLAIAVVTAMFVTRASVPFIGGDQARERLAPPSDKPPPPEAPVAGTVPDPNQTAAARTTPREVAGAQGGSVAAVTVGSDTPPVPLGPQAGAVGAPSQPVPMPPSNRTSPQPAPGQQAPIQVASPSGRGAETVAGVTAGDNPAVYLLQAGAYRSPTEAESMKAKLALMGFETQVVAADVNGAVLHRVRVGPYSGLDSMNRARARLAENGIEATVLRQR